MGKIVSAIFQTARNFFPKRSQRRQVDSTKPAITYSEMDMVVGKQHDLPTFSAMESKNKHVRKETSARCNQKMVHSSTAHVTSGLLNKCFTAEECKNGAINSSALILEKGLLSSCDSVAMESITESQVSSQNNEIRADSLKENVELYSSIPAEPSKYSTAKFKDPCSSKVRFNELDNGSGGMQFYSNNLPSQNLFLIMYIYLLNLSK